MPASYTFHIQITYKFRTPTVEATNYNIDALRANNVSLDTSESWKIGIGINVYIFWTGITLC